MNIILRCDVSFLPQDNRKDKSQMCMQYFIPEAAYLYFQYKNFKKNLITYFFRHFSKSNIWIFTKFVVMCEMLKTFVKPELIKTIKLFVSVLTLS